MIRNSDSWASCFFEGRLWLQGLSTKIKWFNYFFVELFCSNRVEVWCENVDGLEHGLWCPLLRMSELQNLSPFVQIRNNLECFWNFSASVGGKDFSNLSINSSDFWIINGLRVNLLKFFFQFLFPNIFSHTCITKTQDVENVNFLLIWWCMEIFLWCN